MTEIDADPVALTKSSHPLAQRPLLAAVAVCSVLLIGAIAMARSGAEHATDESGDDPEPITLEPADQAAEDVIRGMQKDQAPLYEQSLDGPALEMEPYAPPPLAHIEKSPAEEQLEQALVARSKIEFQMPTASAHPLTGAHRARGSRARLTRHGLLSKGSPASAINRSTRRRPTSSAMAPRSGPTESFKTAERSPSRPTSSRPDRSFQPS